MEVVFKGKMPDGTDIQLENWQNDYPGVFTTYTLAAYPKAKMSSKYGWVLRGERFRLDMSRNWNSNEEVREIFFRLQNGTATLEELYNHYYNGDKDRFYMGFESVATEPIYDWRYA